MKTYLLLALFLFTTVAAQSRITKSFFWEANPIITGDSAVVYVSYRIPYDQMVFAKDNGLFKAGISFFIEAKTETGEIVFRGGDERNVETGNYESTNSSTDYLNGLLVFESDITNLKLAPEVKLSSVKRTYKLPEMSLTINSVDSVLINKPISVYTTGNGTNIYLNNFSGLLPFSDIEKSLIISVANSEVEEIEVDIKQRDSVILSKTASKISDKAFNIKIEDNSLKLYKSDKTSPVSYYLLESISNKLDEGSYDLTTNIDEAELTTSFDVYWVTKPPSLYNLEFAIEILEYIEKEEVVRDLLDNDEDQYLIALSKYWEKFDRNRNTKFNEVMNEFYSRVDSADMNYSVMRTDRGSKTDRGRIYIKYGKPDSVVRTYSATNQIIETWLYDRVNKKFYFTDKSGLGDFTLMN